MNKQQNFLSGYEPCFSIIFHTLVYQCCPADTSFALSTSATKTFEKMYEIFSKDIDDVILPVVVLVIFVVVVVLVVDIFEDDVAGAG